MENLYNKYINNQLSKEELDELKKKSFQKYSREVGQSMLDEWMSTKEDDLQVSDEVVSKIKDRLNKNIDKQHRTTIPLYYRVALWAAAILLPLVVISSLYIYKDHVQAISEELTVVTHVGEKASVNLPDGTEVTLNSDSRLSYIPKVYNKDNRTVTFDGEGYFCVAKDKDRPFIVKAKGLNVNVLGTKFNLLVRKNNTNAELFLESGRVQFTSLLKNKSIIIYPYQKLTMNQLTGEMSVQTETDNLSTAWRRNEMIFRNAPFESVTKCLKNAYGVKIKMDYQPSPKDAFTGTLLTNDLNSDLEVIETTNNLKIIKIGNTLFIRRLK
jgi:transmembrane sensor